MSQNDCNLELLKFQPFHAVADVSFWQELGRRKLEEWKLEDKRIPLRAWFSQSKTTHIPGTINLRSASFVADPDYTPSRHNWSEYEIAGELINTNTLEEFKALNKKKVLEASGRSLLEEMNLDEKLKHDPSRLMRFILITYADLKKHKYVYWFAFPAVIEDSLCIRTETSSCMSMKNTVLNRLGKASFVSLQAWIDSYKVEPKKCLPYFIHYKPDGLKSKPKNLELWEWESLTTEERNCCYFSYVDSCPLPEFPGWPLRNFLTYIRLNYRQNDLEKIICIKNTLEESVLFNVYFQKERSKENANSTTGYNTVGWQPNAKGKMGAKMLDLSTHLDPIKLSSAACDLNLKLMRWRALPSLNTERLAKTSCLLLGAGTLGCSVSRTLLGWGFREITFVDNAQVSYSNPVRQSLFNFENCKEGGSYKAIAASEALRKISPEVKATGHVLTIPMPGHPITAGEHESTLQAVEKLDELIRKHDVIFLLTDTRESRWLPSFLGSHHDKIVINAALGFDSYLVMRHGHGINIDNLQTRESHDSRLGCYFCNDVVAPYNSMKDRTLDQQCTVTRPGLAPIAGALCVEMLVNLLHHPKGNRAPPETRVSSANPSFGLLPHQIRGGIFSFENNLIQGPAFEQCTACSRTIIQAYVEDRRDFLLSAFNNPESLELLTGLDKLKEGSALDEAELDWDEGEDMD